MSYEQKVLAACIKSREAFDKIAGHVKDDDFTEQARFVWAGVLEYYERDSGCASADPDLLGAEIGRRTTSEKHKERFAELVHGLSELDVSPANVIHDFIAVRREAASERLAAALLAGKHNPDLVEEYEKWSSADKLGDEGTGLRWGAPISVESSNPDHLIKVWPKLLNDRLDGGLMRGNHMVVFARPEIGKTLFTVNAVAGFLRQGYRVLYCGNEEPIDRIEARIIGRLTTKTKAEVYENREEAHAEACERGYGNCVTVQLSPGTPREIGKYLEECKPDVLIVDQIRNLHMRSDNFTQSLEKAAIAVRNLALKHKVLAISVTQAGDSASGKQYLEMGDVDSSNTGIPAQADVMVGIGASTEDLTMNRRVISLPKNKASGRHDGFPIQIDPLRSRFINPKGD